MPSDDNFLREVTHYGLKIVFVDGRWQPLDCGEVIRTSSINSTGRGYRTKEEAENALREHFNYIKYGSLQELPEGPSLTERPARGGLANELRLLKQLVEMAAEGNEEDIQNPKAAKVTDEVIAVARRFDQALWEALVEVVRNIPFKTTDQTYAENMDTALTRMVAKQLWDAKGPFLVFMTLRGEGTGIWDGEWDEFYTQAQLESIRTFLEKRLGKLVNIASGGELDYALLNAAYETTEGNEPDATLLPV